MEIQVVHPVVAPDAVDRLLSAFERFPAYTPSGAGSFARKMERRRMRGSAQGDGTGAPPARSASPGPAPLFAPGLGPRADSAAHFLEKGGLRHQLDDPLLRYRNRIFRETLLEYEKVYAPGVEELLANEALADAARRLYGMDLVVPWQISGNVMLPGQELGLHLDTPEFRGATREQLPTWLLCAMQSSGLFERWRVRIATAVVYLGGNREGGGFVCYPVGDNGPPRHFTADHNTAVVLDTDSVFHGVELVPGETEAIRHIDIHTMMVPKGDGIWWLRCGPPADRRTIATFSADQLRFSMTWKGYCFSDEAERRLARNPDDRLGLEQILAIFVDELVERGRLDRSSRHLSEEDLGVMIIDEFLKFPDHTPPSALRI